MDDFEQFLEGATHRLHRTAYVLAGSHENAEDLTQDALIQIKRKWSRVADAEDRNAYVRRVLTLIFQPAGGRR